MMLLELSQEKAITLLNLIENEIWDLEPMIGCDPENDETIWDHIHLLDEIRRDLEKKL